MKENYFVSQRLYSFVGPNRMLYRIDYKNESDHQVPILGTLLIQLPPTLFFTITSFLVSREGEFSDLQLTILKPSTYYNEYIKYVFSDNGMKLIDRGILSR